MEDLLTLRFRQLQAEAVDRAFTGPTVTLYDPFNRPIYIPTRKIGDTITVRKPHRMAIRFGETALEE